MTELTNILNQAGQRKSEEEQKFEARKAENKSDIENAGFTSLQEELTAKGFAVRCNAYHDYWDNGARTNISISRGGLYFDVQMKRTDESFNLQVTRSDIGGCRQVTASLREAWAPQAFAVKDFDEVKTQLGDWVVANEDNFVRNEARRAAEQQQASRPSIWQRMFG